MSQRKLTYAEQKKIGTKNRLAGITIYEQQARAKPPKPKQVDRPKSDLTEIRHCCGHPVGHNLKRFPPAERVDIRNRLAGELCTNCSKALEQEQRRKITEHLPALTGNRDERLDGERARTRLVPLLREEIRTQIISYEIANQEETITARHAELMEALLLRAERNLLRQNSGKWWLTINHKEPREIVRYLLHKVREYDKKKAEATT